jgi:hypothetical protein
LTPWSVSSKRCRTSWPPSGQPTRACGDNPLNPTPGPPAAATVRDSPTDCAATLRELAETADEWGAGWTPEAPSGEGSIGGAQGGRLELPVTAGIRHGVVSCRVRAEPTAGAREGSCRLSLEIESERYRLNVPAVAILSFGGLGAIAATLWPFFPVLLGLAPLAVVLALCAWFLVASRVRTSSPAEFLELVVERCNSGGPGT